MSVTQHETELYMQVKAIDTAINDELANNNHYIPPIEQKRIGEVLTASLDDIDYRSVFFTVPQGESVTNRNSVDFVRPVPLFFTTDEVINSIANSRQKKGSAPVWSKRVMGRDAEGLLHKFYGNIVMSPDINPSFAEIYPNHTLGVIASRLSDVEIQYLRALHSPAKLPHEDSDSSAVSWMLRAAILPRHMLKPMETLDIEMEEDLAMLPDQFVSNIFSGREIFRNSEGHLQLRPGSQNMKSYISTSSAVKALRAHDMTQSLDTHNESPVTEKGEDNNQPISLAFDHINNHDTLLNSYCEAVKTALHKRDGLPKNVINQIVRHLRGQTLRHVPTHPQFGQDSESSNQLASIQATLVSDEFLDIFANLFFYDNVGPEKVAFGVVDSESGSGVEYVTFELNDGLLMTIFASVLGGKNWVHFSQISKDTDAVNEVKQLIQQGLD